MLSEATPAGDNRASLLQFLFFGHTKLKHPSGVLEAAMGDDLSPRHRLVLSTVLNHLHYLEREVVRLDRHLVEAMKPYAWVWRLL